MVDYPGLDSFLEEIEEFSSADIELPHSSSVVVVMTKNHPERLAVSLRHWTSLSIPTILLDDSSNPDHQQASRRLARAAGITYHGSAEQIDFLSTRESVDVSTFVTHLGARGWTLGPCRNYATLVALSAGASRLLLVDDDIIPATPSISHLSLGLLGRFDYAGAHTMGFPDDSVVGHIARDVGISQYDFITGQYLAMRLEPRPEFFPRRYNEDLIFLLAQLGRATFARCGRVVQLTPPDGALSSRRAVGQELGEVLVEGLIQAIETKSPDQLEGSAYWEGILEFRRRCIDELLAKARASRVRGAKRILELVRDSDERLDSQVLADLARAYHAQGAEWLKVQKAFQGTPTSAPQSPTN